MSAAPRLRQWSASPRAGFLLKQLIGLPLLLIAWLLAWPLGRLFPRRRDLVVVIGRDEGRFSDNAKYFFLSGRKEGTREIWFLSGDSKTAAILVAGGANAVRWPSLRGVLLLLRAGTVVADSAEWVRGGRYQLACGAFKLQLWHGVPLKMIELMVLEKRLAGMRPLARLLYLFYTRLYARYPLYDAVLSPSPFLTDAAFRCSFRARHIIECGYPRNDALDPEMRARLGALVDVNTDSAALGRVRTHAKQSRSIVLYAPTFRIAGDNPVGGAVLDYAALDRFAAQNGIVFVVKLHPVLSAAKFLPALDSVIEYSASCDVYPLLGEAAVLVTDYSSISFDFLLRDRPVVFFTYDYDAYRARERDLVFEFETMAPGPRVATQEEMQQAIVAALAGGEDAWQSERSAVRERAFGRFTGSAGRAVWQALDRLP